MGFASSTVGDVYRNQVAIREVSRRAAANGDFLNMVLTDGEETFIAKYWQYPYQGMPDPTLVYSVIGTVCMFNGKLELHIKRLLSMDVNDENGLRIENFRPKSKIPPWVLFTTCMDIAKGIKDTHLRTVMTEYLRNRESELVILPAAKGIHHAYLGGWLEHTIEVANFSLAAGAGCNEDILRVGALMHDFGKIYCCEWKGAAIEETDIGQLIGHIPLGFSKWLNLTHDRDIDDEVATAVGHIILSHHGKMEWGSPVEPKTVEAAIVHQADMMSSRRGIFLEAVNKTEGPWTEKVFPLGTRIYTGKTGGI